jgi:hypothetical protein
MRDSRRGVVRGLVRPTALAGCVLALEECPDATLLIAKFVEDGGDEAASEKGA